MAEAFSEYYHKIGLTLPTLPLYSCANADLFPEDENGVRELSAGQWSVMVRFRETIARMYADGVRYFLEVGPSGNLCAFVNDILSGKEHLAIATNMRQKNDLQQFLIALGHLYANRKEICLERLFTHRIVTPLDQDTTNAQHNRGVHVTNTMPIVHLSSDEQAEIRKLLSVAQNATRTPSASIQPASHDGAIDRPDPRELDADLNGVMTDYFTLMNDFLSQQSRVMENQGRYGADVQGTDVDETDIPPIPFLNQLLEWNADRVIANCHLSVHEYNFLQDHILSGRVSERDPDLLGLSCVPLMVSLEIMGEACSILHGSREVGAIENVKAFAWITLDEEEVELTVIAERLPEEPNRIRAQLINGETVAVMADYIFEADWRLSPLPAINEKKAFKWDGQKLYHIGMFHGPIFRSIRQVDGWDTEGIDASLSTVALDGFFIDQDYPEFVLNPVLLDALGQLAAYWIAQQVGTDFNCFPSTIERIELYWPCPRDVEGLICRARQTPLDQYSTDIGAPRQWQFECLDREGHPLLRVANLVNVYFAVPHSFYEVRRDPLNGWLGRPATVPDLEGITVWELPHFTEAFCSQSGGIFMSILAHAILTLDERHHWRDVKSKRSRIQWLFGRACIKEAVRFWIYRNTGFLLYPSDIDVAHDVWGAPYVDGWWIDELSEAPQLSLSHNKHLSVVAVTSPNQPVGVDIEHVEHIKRHDLIEGAMAANERDRLREFTGGELGRRALRMWCAKEAAAKYLGTGLKGMPQAFQVRFLDQEWHRAHVTHNEATVEVTVDDKDKSIIAIAFPQGDN